MPSASHSVFIMGFIHIDKFASNKCTVLKLAHFTAARKTAVLYEDFEYQLRAHAYLHGSRQPRTCVGAPAGRRCDGTWPSSPGFGILSNKDNQRAEQTWRVWGLTGPAPADSWRRVLGAAGGDPSAREQEQAGRPRVGGSVEVTKGRGRGGHQGRPGWMTVQEAEGTKKGLGTSTSCLCLRRPEMTGTLGGDQPAPAQPCTPQLAGISLGPVCARFLRGRVCAGLPREMGICDLLGNKHAQGVRVRRACWPAWPRSTGQRRPGLPAGSGQSGGCASWRRVGRGCRETDRRGWRPRSQQGHPPHAPRLVLAGALGVAGCAPRVPSPPDALKRTPQGSSLSGEPFSRKKVPDTKPCMSLFLCCCITLRRCR